MTQRSSELHPAAPAHSKAHSHTNGSQTAGGEGSDEAVVSRRAEGSDQDGMKKVFVRTYGCQMNVYDSDRMADVLARRATAPRTAWMTRIW